jgi:hypothetical protein
VQKTRPAVDPLAGATSTGVWRLQWDENGPKRGLLVGPDGRSRRTGEERKMSETVFAFRAEGVVKIIRKLEAATRLAKALEEVLPAMYGIGDKEQAEQEALVALATWEEASREGGSWN